MAEELHALFPEGQQHFFRIECAWCKRHLGWKRKHVAVPGETTYGICPPCAAAMRRKSDPCGTASVNP